MFVIVFVVNSVLLKWLLVVFVKKTQEGDYSSGVPTAPNGFGYDLFASCRRDCGSTDAQLHLLQPVIK